MKLEDFRVIDLTHPVTANMPVWPGDPLTRLKTTATLPQQGYYLHRLSIGEHSGTHVGAPRHFLETGAEMAAIPAERLFLQATKLDVRTVAGDRNPFLVKPEQIVEWERRHDAIQSGGLVLLHTGWSDFWHDPERYWGPHFPGITPESADLLVRERGVKAVGIDSAG
ncbi:cyclase family protein, partial [candidate division KSB1 bacterium]|nr:cyclase family protein [candidate division KSB1 bacterium]